MPAQAGIQILKLGPRLRGGDKLQTLSFRINSCAGCLVERAMEADSDDLAPSITAQKNPSPYPANLSRAGCCLRPGLRFPTRAAILFAGYSN